MRTPRRLVRGLRRRNPEHRVKIEERVGIPSCDQVPEVWRVEGPTKDPDPQLPGEAARLGTCRVIAEQACSYLGRFLRVPDALVTLVHAK